MLQSKENFHRGTFHQGNIGTLNVYEPNNRALKYLKQTLTKLKGKYANLQLELEHPMSAIDW